MCIVDCGRMVCTYGYMHMYMVNTLEKVTLPTTIDVSLVSSSSTVCNVLMCVSSTQAWLDHQALSVIKSNSLPAHALSWV